MAGGASGVAVRERMTLVRLFAVAGITLSVAGGVVAAPVMGPIETSGYLGFNHRSVSDGGDEGSGQQITGSVNSSTYLGAPWMARTSLNLGLSQDSSEYQTSEGDTTTSDTSIVTGDWLLNVLPQSKTPFDLQYQVTDSRVTLDGVGATPITYIGQDYSSAHLGLRQSYLTGNGGRYRLSLDDRSWESDAGGEFSSQVLGVEADVRRASHHLVGRFRDESTEYSNAATDNENQVVDVSHFYYPVRGLRTDSKVSYYNYDRSFIDPASQDLRLSTTEISQVSGNAFWRPENKPVTVSGGVRVMQMDGSSGDAAGFEQNQAAFNAGAFYQLNKRMRLDASISSVLAEVSGIQYDSHRQKLGGLYQSDWSQIARMDYQWYTGGAFRHQVDSFKETVGMDFDAGHNASRTLWLGERTSPSSISINLGQNARFLTEDTTPADDVVQEQSLLALDLSVGHTASLAFNQRVWSGNTLAQVSFSDVRGQQSLDLGEESVDSSYASQLLSFQFNRDQELGRWARLIGNLSGQWSSIEDDTDGTVYFISETDTWTGKLRFEWDPIWGVSRVGMSSEYVISKTSLDGAINRTDWINQAAYSIGMLETSVTIRLTEADSENYDLVYFRVMRRF